MQVILNADDFGRSQPINQAILRAHQEGVLTSASLMVGGEAFEAAIALARQTPTLAVGLHITLVDGPPALPPSEIPHLVDDRGRFPNAPVQLGLRYLLSQDAQQELARELSAQFERFAATGLPLAHVDGHQHMHLHPVVLRLLLPLAERYGARGLRLPRDDLRLALSYDRRRAGIKILWAVIFGPLCRWAQKQLQGHSLLTTHRVYGLMQSGKMETGYVVKVLRQLDVPTAELYFHPTTGPRQEAFGPNPSDLATLLSPAVREVIRERGLRLTNYLALQEG